MIALIDDFAKELTDIAEFAQSTVENYVACVAAFFDYAQNRLRIDPVLVKGCHIVTWIGEIQKAGFVEDIDDKLRIFHAVQAQAPGILTVPYCTAPVQLDNSRIRTRFRAGLAHMKRKEFPPK